MNGILLINVKDANMFVSDKMPATMLCNVALINVVLYVGSCFESVHYLTSATLLQQVMAGLLYAIMFLHTGVSTLLIHAVQFEMKTGLVNVLSIPNLKPDDVDNAKKLFEKGKYGLQPFGFFYFTSILPLGKDDFLQGTFLIKKFY